MYEDANTDQLYTKMAFQSLLSTKLASPDIYRYCKATEVKQCVSSRKSRSHLPPSHGLSLLAEVTAGHVNVVLSDDTVLVAGAPAQNASEMSCQPLLNMVKYYNTDRT